MNESAAEILSRDEIDAILSALDDEPGFEKSATAKRAPTAAWRSLPLARALREFGADRSRGLATLYQRPFSFSLISLESVPAGEFAASMLDTDRPALLEFLPSGATGAILIGRTLLFGWLGLAFGGRPDPETPVPARSYTRIEERFLRRCLTEICAELPSKLCMTPVPELRLGELAEPSVLVDLCAPRLVVASFEVTGFGEAGRLRIATPDEFSVGARKRRMIAPSSALRDQVLDVPVEVHAELGARDMNLAAVRRLAVGDVIEFGGLPDGEVVVRVEGESKFHAVRGRSGSRTAIQITKRL